MSEYIWYSVSFFDVHIFPFCCNVKRMEFKNEQIVQQIDFADF